MITREEIRSIPELHKSIERDKEQLTFLREKATCVPSTATDRERVQTSPSNDGMKYIEAAVDLEKDIRIAEAELKELQDRARAVISKITDPLASRIMRLRYLKCYTWEDVAELTGYDERHVKRIENATLKDVIPCPSMSSCVRCIL